MTVVLLSLIAGCVFYIVRIVMDFHAHETSVVPRMEDLERKLGRLSGQMEAEKPVLQEVRLRLVILREEREVLMRQLEEMKDALRVEEAQHQTLTIEVQKRTFRGTLARGRKLALK